MGLLQLLLSESAAWRVCANKNSYSAYPLEPHHKAICNMKNSRTPYNPDIGRDGERREERWKNRRGTVTPTKFFFAKVTLDHYAI